MAPKHPAYGPDHVEQRKLLLAQVEASPGDIMCALCGDAMFWPAQQLELHHSTTALKAAGRPGDVLVHRRCNRSEGGQRGAAISHGYARPCDHPVYTPPQGACLIPQPGHDELRCGKMHLTYCGRCGAVINWGRAA